MSINGAPVIAAIVVAVDVGKNTAALSVTSADRHRLFGPAGFAMSAPALASVLQRVCAVLPPAPVKVGVEAAGHYHRPLLGATLWPAGWEVVELSPTTAPRLVILAVGQAPASSTAPPVCPRHSTSRLGSVATAASAGKAVWLCGGR
jgi:Transposase